NTAVGLFDQSGTLRSSDRQGAPADIDGLMTLCAGPAQALKPLVTDTRKILNRRIAEGARVLFEGAQGTMLDIDHGSYPYVTSSNSTAGGACTGLGVSPTTIDGVLGIFKAYSTRVGEGPFPTEDRGEAGELIRKRGHEFGTVTGRAPRRGWVGARAGRFAARVNGMDCAALTLLDVLDEFDELNVCTGYKYGGNVLKEFPVESWILSAATPVYTKVP